MKFKIKETIEIYLEKDDLPFKKVCNIIEEQFKNPCVKKATKMKTKNINNYNTREILW